MLFKQKQLGMKFRAEVKLLTDPIGQMSVPDALFITEYATHKTRAGKIYSMNCLIKLNINLFNDCHSKRSQIFVSILKVYIVGWHQDVAVAVPRVY